MDQKAFVKSVLSYNKAAFNQFFNISNTAQQEIEKFASFFLSQESTPEELKNIMENWLSALSQNRKDVQESIENSLRQMESYILSLIP